MISPDVLTALQTLLKADSAVNTLVAGRVYRTDLPDGEAASMPRNCIILQRAGGRNDMGYLPLARHRIDVKSYGRNASQAAQVRGAVQSKFKWLYPTTVGDCRITAITIEGGLVDTFDDVGNWPLVWESFLVHYSEVPVVV